MSEKEIEANAAADADNPPWTEAELEAARRALIPERGRAAWSRYPFLACWVRGG